MRFRCFFFLTEKQYKKHGDFGIGLYEGHSFDYMKYVSSLIEKGDHVKMLINWHKGIKCGDTDTVVSNGWKNMYGDDWVTLQFDRLGYVMDVGCEYIEILN